MPACLFKQVDAVFADRAAGGMIHRLPPVELRVGRDDPEHRAHTFRIHPGPVFPGSVEGVVRDDISPLSRKRGVADITDSAAGIAREFRCPLTDMTAVGTAFIFFPVDLAIDRYIMMFRLTALPADAADLFAFVRDRLPLVIRVTCGTADDAPAVFKAVSSGSDLSADTALFLAFSRDRLINVPFISHFAAAFARAAVPLVSE